VLLVVDQNAGPDGHGAVFQLGTDDKVQPFLSSPRFRQPQDILQEPDGSFLVLDYYEEGGVGKVFRFSKDRETCTELPLPPGLVDPYQFEHAPDGSIWIVDKNADPLGLGRKVDRKTGTLWRLSVDRKTLEVIATGPPLAAPSAILFVGDDAFLMDADVFQGKVFDPKVAEGAIFRVAKPPAKLEMIARFDNLISPLGMHREANGTYLVVDVNADPVHREQYRGAVYRVDPEAGTTTVFANHDDFRDPANCIVWQGRFLVVDANADPLKLGDDGSRFHFAGNGRGGVYEVDRDTGAVALFLASPEFVNPIRLREVRL
jgi:sugar lactone lactonase YvrE